MIQRRWPLARAAHCIASGGLVAYPTEGVYGLGCDPLNATAVMRLLKAKQRPLSKGLILIAADFNQLKPFVDLSDKKLLQRVLATWPGPVTWLMPTHPATPSWLTGAHDTLAVRVTAHPLAAALCRLCRSPLVSTSANISGHPVARNPLQVRKQLLNSVDLILHGNVLQNNQPKNSQPSEIRDAVSGRIIRPA